MNKIVLSLLALFISNSVFSQGNEWEWNEHTKDVAYEAPNSKFAKKWFVWEERKNNYSCLNLSPNGIVKLISEEMEEGIPYTTTLSGTWKRSEKMLIVCNFTNVSYVADKDVYAKLSLRRRDDIQKTFTLIKTMWKKKYPQGLKLIYDIYMVDDDHLLIKEKRTSVFDRLISESLKKQREGGVQ